MSQHMREARKVPTAAVAAGAVVAVALVAGGIAFALTRGNGAGEKIEPETPAAQPSDQGTDASGSSEPAATLPFSLDGVPAEGNVTEVSDAAAATLSGTWTFGGDYALIGSFPIDATTVFGSATDDPATVTGYAASLITDVGAAALEEAQTSEPYFEPQDGTGTTDRVVWRSSELSNTPVSATDNWRVQLWTEAAGTVILGSAEELNGTTQTPELDGEIVPTANEKAVYFASMAKVDDAWQPEVLSWSVGDDLGTMTVVGQGSYPAATKTGCLFAGDLASNDTGTLYTALYQWNGSASSKVFSLSSEDGTWSISGVWASNAYCVIAFSSTSSDTGSYLGVWDASFEKFCGWVKLTSDRAVGSANDEWFVWGAGSASENAGMYALRLSDMTLLSLGVCEGYSRPSLASDYNVVMVPVSNGGGAVKYTVGTLE